MYNTPLMTEEEVQASTFDSEDHTLRPSPRYVHHYLHQLPKDNLRECCNRYRLCGYSWQARFARSPPVDPDVRARIRESRIATMNPTFALVVQSVQTSRDLIDWENDCERVYFSPWGARTNWTTSAEQLTSISIVFMKHDPLYPPQTKMIPSLAQTPAEYLGELISAPRCHLNKHPYPALASTEETGSKRKKKELLFFFLTFPSWN